jgi:glycosyltransferase involved in cell wall biosynthesis
MLQTSGFDFDIIHSFWLGRPSQVAGYLHRRRPRPWIVSVAGQELSSARLEALSPLHRWLAILRYRTSLAKASAVTAGSRQLVERIEQLGYRASWWPLFPDVARYGTRPARGSFTGHPFRLITVADHNPAKDKETLLRSVQELKRRGHSIHLDWVGLELNPDETARLIASLDIAECVTVYGHQPHNRIADFLQNADVYVQSSLYESQGVSVCEAAACGLPIIGTATGILSELVPEGAIAVPCGDPYALADALTQVLSSEKLRKKLGQGALAWMSRHSLDWTVREAVSRYETLVRKDSNHG